RDRTLGNDRHGFERVAANSSRRTGTSQQFASIFDNEVNLNHQQPPTISGQGNTLPQSSLYGIDSHTMEIKHQKKAAIASVSQGDQADRSSVRSVERALTLLGSFSAASPVLTLSELAQIAELPVSTASRLLTTLEASGFVRRLPN